MTTNQTIDGVPLLPCPFCGGEPYGTNDHYVHDDLSPMPCVECRSCSAHLKASDWNRRVAETSDWERGLEDADGNELVTIRADEYSRLKAAQPQAEPVAWMFKYLSHSDSPPYGSFEVTDFHQNPKAPGIEQHTPLYAEQHAPAAVVPELTTELRWILGQMCFQHIHTAQALRLMGHEIARKAEDEQAVTIYWMLGHYLKDPANWRKNATDEMKAAAPSA